MRIRTVLLLPVFVALTVALWAQPTEQKPSPVPVPNCCPPKAPPKRPAPPARPPSISIKSATPEGIVTGHSSDPGHKVRLTVASDGAEFRNEPAFPDTSGDFRILLLRLNPGWIVQAWIVDGDKELAHSVPFAVSGTLVTQGGVGTQASGGTQVGGSGQAGTGSQGGGGGQGGGQQVAPVVVAAADDPCSDGNSDTEAKLQLSEGDSKIAGRTFKFLSASGKVTVCVNGAKRLIRDTSDAASAEGTFKNSKFDVSLASEPKLAEGNFVLVVLETDKKERATIAATVGPSKTIVAKACDAAADGDLRIYDEPVYSGSLSLKATLPGQTGTVTICVNDTQADIAAGPGPATATTAYSKELSVASPKLDLLLKGGVREDQVVRIAWVDTSKSKRVVKDVNVKPARLSRVILRTVPKEGETKIIVDTAPQPTGVAADAPKLSLSVFVNQDGVKLLDTKGAEIDSAPVEATGITGINLKDPVDGGDCVVVVEHYGPQLPADLDFSSLVCDAQHKPPKTPDPKLTYAQSYPLLANAVFDWGRVRGYMAAGGLFTFDDKFQNQSIFLSFNLTKNWLWGGPFWRYEEQNGRPVPVRSYRRAMFETFFDARLTTLPIAACTPGFTPPAGSTAKCPNTVETFLAAQKAGSLTGGATLPFIVSTWHYGHRPYSMTFGPIAKVGLITPVGDLQNNAQKATDHQFYTNFGFGNRLGLYKMGYSTNVAPELESYVDVVIGRYSNFDVSPRQVFSPTYGIMVDAERALRPWRIGIEGVLKIPTTPFILGFGANIHQNFGLGNSHTVDNAKDSLQFLFGAKFDAGKLFTKIGSIK